MRLLCYLKQDLADSQAAAGMVVRLGPLQSQDPWRAYFEKGAAGMPPLGGHLAQT
jgi:hypothetical protein